MVKGPVDGQSVDTDCKPVHKEIGNVYASVESGLRTVCFAEPPAFPHKF